MDRFLLRPVHPIFQAMMTGFDEDGWGDLIFGSIILIVSIVRLQIFSAWLLLIPVVCISASLIYAALSIATSSISFWAIDSQDITMATRDFQEFSRYPLTIYPTAFKFVFSSIIPIGFTAYYPSLFFVVDQSSANIFWLIGGCLFSVLFFAACCKWWSFALRFYSSTGQ
jgi:ABC-2 type transport system permease protein